MGDPAPSVMDDPAPSANGHTTTKLYAFFVQTRKSIISTFNRVRSGNSSITTQGRSDEARDLEAVGRDPVQDEAANNTRVQISNKALNFASGIIITASATGTFGLSQLNNKNTRDHALKIIYIACNISLLAAFSSASVVVLIVSLTQRNFRHETLILKSIIGVGIVLTTLGYGMGAAFNLRRC